MPRAVSNRGSGRWRESSIAASNLSALIVAKPSRVSNCSRVSPYKSAASATKPVAVS